MAQRSARKIGCVSGIALGAATNHTFQNGTLAWKGTTGAMPPELKPPAFRWSPAPGQSVTCGVSPKHQAPPSCPPSSLVPQNTSPPPPSRGWCRTLGRAILRPTAHLAGARARGWAPSHCGSARPVHRGAAGVPPATGIAQGSRI
jgi:hypothetical protein